MTAPHCFVVGAGRMTGGFVVPLLRAAGWEVTIACRDPLVREAISKRHGFTVRITGEPHREQWVEGVDAVALDDPGLDRVVARADLIATAVGPSALSAVGHFLAPLLRSRMDAGPAPVNIITFENHRRAPEILTSALIGTDGLLAPLIGGRIGISGAAVWRIIASRVITGDGLRFDANDEDECYADALSLVPGAAPHDGSLAGVTLVHAFDDRMVEKLWLFNAGHCAAAYLGWRAGHETLEGAMRDAAIRSAVADVVTETQQALHAQIAARSWGSPLPHRSVEGIIGRYVDPSLVDPVTRVGREPRRKLAPDDRLIGPAVACLSSGIRPKALARTAATALAYADPADAQAVDLQRELALVGVAEVLATVSGLHPTDELSKIIHEEYERLDPREVAT